MELNNKIVPPHLNAEVYRTYNFIPNLTTGLDYIRINTDGSVLIGSSELTGRNWCGQACVYKTVAEAFEPQKENTKNIFLTSGTADGCFIEISKKVLLCEDSGAVSVWTKSDDEQAWHSWTEECSVAEHDDAALAVDCLSPAMEYVTAGADGNIKVWDISTMICMRNYESAHSKQIYGVAVRPQSNSNFASGSMDQYLSLWDEKTDMSVLELQASDCGIRCLTWINENQILFGDESGALKLVDIRNPDSITKLTQFPAAVHKLAIHSEFEKVAVCCDNKIVSVCEINVDNNCNVVYHDRHLHNKFVRGLAWDIEDKNVLHSVGWDGEIKTHRIS